MFRIGGDMIFFSSGHEQVMTSQEAIELISSHPDALLSHGFLQQIIEFKPTGSMADLLSFLPDHLANDVFFFILSMKRSQALVKGLFRDPKTLDQPFLFEQSIFFLSISLANVSGNYFLAISTPVRSSISAMTSC